jgi:hypothetical protein
VTERQDRSANRTAPAPARAARTGAFLLGLWTLLAVLGILNAGSIDSEWQWIVVVVWILILSQHVLLQVHNYRYAVWRAIGIYGSGWRDLSKSDRDARWRWYCQQWDSRQQGASF